MHTTSSSSQIQSDLVHLYRKALLKGVPLEELEKKVRRHVDRLEVTESIESTETEERTEEIKRRIPKFVRVGAFVLPVVFLSIGLYLVGSAVVPILGYYANTLPSVRASTLTAPIPKEQVMDVTPLVIAQSADSAIKEIQEPRIIDEELDYTNLNNWFENVNVPELTGQAQASEQRITQYTIDIPKLDIANAVVEVGGTDLNESLIAYPGTALPGEHGAPVVFGHSVLRQWYNPSEKNPRRYNSIFSTIMTLEPGDKIYVTADGVRYTYLVQDKTEVKPEDVYILNQDFGSKKLKLVTCTPEGTYLRRGVITAQLINEE